MLDLIVRGGTVVDGTGAPRFQADVAVEDGKIVAIGELADAEATRQLDATGMLVTPGFIDIHSHSDFTLLVDPRAQSQIFQGVTTELVGNCGHGCAPITDLDLVTGNIYGYTPDLEVDWSTMAGYLEKLDSVRPAVNVATLVPNGNLRLAVMDDPEQTATPDEVMQMGRLVEEGLEAGAFGFSNGLEYPAERASTEEETIELCRIVARAGGLYATHERNKDTHAVEAVEEGIRVAQAAGTRLQLSHIVPRRGSPPRSLERAIEAVERAHADGMDVGFDAHTRLYGITNLSAALPTWAFKGGPEKLEARLRDPEARARMRRFDSIVSTKNVVGFDRLFLFTSEGSPELVGKTFAEMIPPGGDLFDPIFDILMKECADPHRSLVISHSYEEEWVRQALRHPLCTTESDATALAVDGPLADSVFLGAYTWAAWFFRRLVNETREFTVEEAINKLTAMPAARIGLNDRGRLEVGARADLTVFDPVRFGERGTLEAPSQLAEGVAHVIVNGGVTLENGSLTGDRTGQVLRRR